MKTIELDLGIIGIQWEFSDDDRGRFFRIWEASLTSICSSLSQISVSTNFKAGTLRGLHFQTEPFQEAKVVSCLTGHLFDVIVDVDPSSSNFGKTLTVELSPDCEINAVIIPKGFAHGYLTLTDETNLLYLMDNSYSPRHARGINWQDSDLSIPWPREVSIISESDQNLPYFHQYFGR